MLTINWKYTGGGSTFYNAGVSENAVYITPTNPATAICQRGQLLILDKEGRRRVECGAWRDRFGWNLRWRRIM
jgi:hypothetical protein